MLPTSRSKVNRKRTVRRRGLGNEEDKSPEEVFRQGVASILYLLRGQHIDQKMADSLLTTMLTGYVETAIDQELGESIAHLIASAFAQYERESNV